MLLRSLVLLALTSLAITAIAIVLMPSPAEGADRPRADAARGLDLVLFYGAELGDGRGGVAGGFKVAPEGGLDRSGPILMALGNIDAALETVDDRVTGGPGETWRVPRSAMAGSLLVGMQWMGPRIVTTVAAGAGVARRQERAADGALRWGEAELGPTVLAEAWAHPTPDLLLTGSAIYAGATKSAWTRISGGIRVPPRLAIIGSAFAGPEASYYAEDGYEETRIGVHLTGLRIGGFEMRLGGGLAMGDAQGAYVSFTTHTRM